MLKMFIDNEEVVSNKDFTIKEEMLNASSTILNNTYPKTWETDHDYISRFYYPKDYSKMVLTNETYYPHIDGTIIEGTNFQINADTTLEDSYYFKGDTTQVQTPGNQLFNFASTNYIDNVNDITITGTGDNFTISSSQAYGLRSFCLGIVNYNTLYKYMTNNYANASMSVYVTNSNSYLTWSAYTSDRTAVNTNWNTNTLNLNAATIQGKYLWIQMRGSATDQGYSNCTYTNFVLSKTQVSAYEPYTYGATPNPNYPQEIQVVTGNQEIEVCGKNLFSGFAKGVGLNSTNGSQTTNANAGTTDFIPIIFTNNETYYLSGLTNTLNSYIASYNKEKVFLGRTNATGVKNWYLTKNVFTNGTPRGTGEIAYIRITQYYISGNTGTIDDIDNLTPQLERGNQATTYEPYTGDTYSINLGRNILDLNTLWQGYWSNSTMPPTKGGTTTTTYRSFEMVLSAGTYTLQSNRNLHIVRDFTNYSYATYDTLGTFSNVNKATFTMTQDGIAYISLRKYDNTAWSDTDDILWLEKGSSTTPYTPYFEPIELCKIDNVRDRIYKGRGVNLLDTSICNRINCVRNADGSYRSNITDLYYCGLTTSSLNDILMKNKGNTLTFSVDKAIANRRCSIIIYGTRTNGAVYQEMNGAYENRYVTGTIADDFTSITYIELRFNRYGSRHTDTTTLFYDFQLELGNLTSYEPYNAKDKWILHKEIGKVIFTGSSSENWSYLAQNYNWFYIFVPTLDETEYQTKVKILCNYYKAVKYSNTINNGECTFYKSGSNHVMAFKNTNYTQVADFKTWLSTHNTIVYYVLATPTYTEITNEELINQLNNIKLLSGINNIAITSANLPAIMNLHYNFQTERTEVDLVFSGIVKNTNNISLNPREPKYCGLQVLDYKTLLSEGDTLDYVISNKTILEAIQMVVDSISSYGFEVGNINILNGDEVIGAYSTENKTAYDVLQYLADISGAKWTCRRKDESSMYIDFYDPTLMPRGKQIEYTSEWACENNLMDIKFNYGTRDYRNKQVIISDEVVGDIDYIENLVGDNVNTNFLLSSNIASITSIVVNGENQSVATETDKDIGIYADFYYKPGSNEITSNDTIPSGTIIKVSYKPIIKGREVITNDDEIARLNNQLGVNGTIARYETRNDETDSNKLLAIGETYLRYKGEAEITLTITTKDNDLYDVGQMVYFNAPIPELAKDYLVKSKQINIIANDGDPFNVFYTFILSSSFNAEREINWFDNQRNKNKGNIAEGEFISRNIDISSTANIIWDNLKITEVNNITGNNELNATLNAPLNE